jgi:hypothetical protein
MKIKNLIIGAFAFLIAIGAAFSSSTPWVNPVFIRAKVTPNDPWECFQINVACDNVPGTSCVAHVTVTRAGYPSVTATPLRTFLPYTPTCQIKLQGTTYFLMEFEFYDVNNQ